MIDSKLSWVSRNLQCCASKEFPDTHQFQARFKCGGENGFSMIEPS
jgi:hypothetical protein